MRAAPKGLYIHIPFCLKKCSYCNYVITTNRSDEMRSRFFRALETEMKHVVDRYGRLEFDTLYLGGGTPSALNENEMERLFRLIHKHFRIHEGAEVTCETNPGEADRRRFVRFFELGINRISLGVQSFQDALLKAMGRIHDSKQIFTAFDDLKTAGFTNISADLILRLPRQSLQDLESSLRQTIRLDAKQVVLYDLNIHQGTLFGKLEARGELPLPSETEHLRMQKRIEAILITESDFRQYEISSFARPSFESRHNLIYWQNYSYLGLGPGAFSYMKGRRYQYARDVQTYLSKIAAGDWSLAEEDLIEGKTKEMETLLTGLRLEEGVRLKNFPLIRRHVEREAAFLADRGLLQKKGDVLSLSSKGKRLAESVFTQLSL